ncbi:MAG: hypothetical protein ACTSRS_03485 [Candidatus Helarchaeota archaeon]
MQILDYLLNLGITALGRSLDILSTYYITPNLKLETNRLISRLGWKGAFLLQIPVLILGTIFRPVAIFFFAWSIIIAATNISGAWFIRNFPGGETKYVQYIHEAALKSKLRNIFLDESSPLILFFLPSLLVWIWISLEVGDIFSLIIQDSFLSYVIIVTGAFILHGILSFIRNFLYVYRLRKLKMKEEVILEKEVIK